jgi:16S rRNA (adenine1518-N6/adenine1519-N6)-dimethyltransferase
MEQPRPKKSLGQNFLTDTTILSRIVELVNIAPGDRILEVGPGRGALTRLLAERAARVVAVEIDRQLASNLAGEFSGQEHVTIVTANILRADLARLPCQYGAGDWKVAANLPYNISTQILFLFIENRLLFSRLVLMLQKEVGDRLAASPGCKDYGALSVFCRLYFDIRRELIVRPGAFYPVPKVDSTVLSFVPLPEPRADVGNEAFFRKVVKAAFSQRRKTLLNCLRSAGIGMDQALRQALADCGIDPGRRGETLTLEEFAALTRALLPLNPDMPLPHAG